MSVQLLKQKKNQTYKFYTFNDIKLLARFFNKFSFLSKRNKQTNKETNKQTKQMNCKNEAMKNLELRFTPEEIHKQT